MSMDWGHNCMKKISILIITVLFVINIVQASIIWNKNNKIQDLTHTEQQELEIFQLTREFAQDLQNYEKDTENGTYYYQAIAKLSWMLTYMQYKVKYENQKDALFQYNNAMNNLFGFMITEQGKKQVLSHSYKILSLLDEIVMSHFESDIKDRNNSISKLEKYLQENLSISIEETNDNSNNLEETVKILPDSSINPKEILPDYKGLDELPQNYTIEAAKNDGCVVFEYSHLTYGGNQWEDFVESTKNGKTDTIRIVHYLPEAPDLFIEDLLFDGSNYYVVQKDRPIEKYKYLNYYQSLISEEYILTDIKDISREELQKAMSSALAHEQVKQKTIFSRGRKY